MCSDCIFIACPIDGQLDAVYDFTIAYPKTVPQTEIDMLKGKFPEEIHFNIKR
jgi:lysocardiolipin and lysophospholipid acyltransferase